MGAGAINPFYTPQTSNPISMFVEDKLPVELMLKAGLMKQGQQDEAMARIANMAVDPNAVYAQDKLARQTIAEDASKYIDNSFNKDWTDPQNHISFIKKINDLKNNEILKTTAANTANYNAWQDQIKAYKTAGKSEYAKELEFLVSEQSDAYAKSGVVSSVGALTQKKGSDLIKAGQEVMDGLQSDSAESIITAGDLIYKNGLEELGKSKIYNNAAAIADEFMQGDAGQQLMARYKMQEKLSPEYLNYEESVYNEKTKKY